MIALFIITAFGNTIIPESLLMIADSEHTDGIKFRELLKNYFVESFL